MGSGRRLNPLISGARFDAAKSEEELEGPVVSIPLSAGHVSTHESKGERLHETGLNPLISGARFDEGSSEQDPFFSDGLNPLISGARFDSTLW